ncbi:SCO2524 family protein [Streptomyces sp. NPDC002285]
MQIKPRQQLLDVWRALARHSFRDGQWDWGDTDLRSSVADAERLLCLMYPATVMGEFRIDDPDRTDADVLDALASVGGLLDIGPRITEVLSEFMDTHTVDGQPSFAGGSHCAPCDPGSELTAEQRHLGVVDSFSMSVSLCLATLAFLTTYVPTVSNRPHQLQTAEELRVATEARLSAAMVNLLRSFTVSVFKADSPQGRALCDFLGQGKLSAQAVEARFERRFGPLRAALAEILTLGVDIPRDLDSRQFFECGWSWGVVCDAPAVETCGQFQPSSGIARPVPNLYFTAMALDKITDLFSERTLALDLLTPEQRMLAEALRLRWEITQQFWSGIARFDEDRWPLEDIPWRETGEQVESVYSTLSVAAILVHDLMRRRAGDDIARMVAVMERLAAHGRVTTRAARSDPAVELHNPGVPLPLPGGEALGPPMQWIVTDFSAQLLKETIQLAVLSRTIASHDRLLTLAEEICDHVWDRRISAGEGIGLWDDIQAVFPRSPARGRPLSWSLTERVTECIVVAADLYSQPPIHNAELVSLAKGLLNEASRLLGSELLQPASVADGARDDTLTAVEAKLRDARALVDQMPGTACTVAQLALADLHALLLARQAAERGA